MTTAKRVCLMTCCRKSLLGSVLAILFPRNWRAGLRGIQRIWTMTSQIVRRPRPMSDVDGRNGGGRDMHDREARGET